MNRKSSFSQLFKGLLFAKGLFFLSLLTPGIVTAAGTGSATLDDIKDTNYSIPSGAYFVAPNGKDTNSGRDATSPWSVKKALASAPEGSTIVFRNGIYRDVDTRITKKMTLQAYPHEKPMLKGSVNVTGWVADGSTWRKDGWNYSFPPNMGSEYIDPNYPMAGYRDMVYVNGGALKQVKSKAEVGPGKFYVNPANNQLYIGENPSGKTVESTALDQAFEIKKGNPNPSGTVIRGLGFAHYADRGIMVQSARVTLENNTFVWNGQQGIVTFGGDSNSIIRGNIFSYNGRVGLRVSASDQLLLENNTFSYNNVENYSKIWDAAGVKFTRTDGAVVRNNLVENNASIGLWIDISATNTKIIHNTARSNENIGIFFEISHKGIIASNLVHDNGIGIMLSNSSSAKVYNNTLVNNRTNLLVKDHQRNNTDPAEINAGITWITRDHVIKNNILSETSGGAHLSASNCALKEPSSRMITALDYNAYYRKSSTAPRNIIKWSLSAANCDVPFTSRAEFTPQTGYERNGRDIVNVSNPFFVDPSRGDYRLKPDSPAIKIGQPLPTDVADAIGVAPGVSVDLGKLQPTR